MADKVIDALQLPLRNYTWQQITINIDNAAPAAKRRRIIIDSDSEE